MTANLIYSCNVCGKSKAEVNHWFIVILGTEFVEFSGKPITLAGEHSDRFFVVFRWSDSLAFHRGAHHVCGQEHATQLVSRWLHNGTFEKESAKEAPSPPAPSQPAGEPFRKGA